MSKAQQKQEAPVETRTEPEVDPTPSMLDATIAKTESREEIKHSGGWNQTGDNEIVIGLLGQTMHTFDVHTPAGIRRREKHDADECEPADEWINKDFNVVAASVGLAEFPGPGGEVVIQRRLVLELDTGEMIQLFSNGSVKSFTARLKTHEREGGLSDAHPLRLTLVRRQTKAIDPVTKKPSSYYWLNRPE